MNTEDLVLIVCAVVWVIGFIREMAIFHRQMSVHNIKYPYPAIKIVLPILVFFTWPYWFFYKGNT